MPSRGRVTEANVTKTTCGRDGECSLSAAPAMFAHLHSYPTPTSLQTDLHVGFEAGVVLAGGEEREIGGVRFTLSPGGVWLCGMWEPHSWRVTVPQTRELQLVFLPEFLGEEMLGGLSWLSLFSALSGPAASGPRGGDRKATRAIGEELWRELREPRAGWPASVRLGLVRLLLALSRYWPSPGQVPPEGAEPATTIARIAPALTLTHRPTRHRVSVLEAAAACGLSRSHFDLLFRRAMGVSFGHFSMRARLAGAAHQLASTESPVDAIAVHCGFVDASHLHRAFQRHYGCTPAAYRRRFR